MLNIFNRFCTSKNDAYQVSVLMVCTANYCRSPMAEGMLRHKLIERGLSPYIKVDSAGTHVSRNGQRPDFRAQQAVLSEGVDITRLRSRSIQLTDFADFDYILAMDNNNYRSLSAICSSEHQHKLALIMSFAPEIGVSEVPDPYFSNEAGFQQVYTFLEQAILGLVDSVNNKYGLS